MAPAEVLAYAMRGLLPDGKERPTRFDLAAAEEIIRRVRRLTDEKFLHLGVDE